MSDIFTRQKDLDAIQARLRFFRDSYQGGIAYMAGKYLKPHRREKGDAYKTRLEFASFRNYCAPIIDIYTAYLYREKITRELKNLEAETEEFMLDADFEGHTFQKFIRETSKHNGKYGFFGVVVDKPQAEGGSTPTKAQEEEQGIRPYVVPYSPLQFIQILFKRVNGRIKLVKAVLEEDTGVEKLRRFRVWTRDAWEVWEKDERDSSNNKEPARTENGTHTLGEVPLVLIKNRDKFHKIIGISDIEDIADINKKIYNYDSYADQIIGDTGFPFLEIPSDGSSSGGETVIGTGNMLQKNEEGHGSEWIEPAHTSLSNILSWRDTSVEDIREMAKTGKASTTDTQAESGVALEIRFDQLNAVLADKAENMEGAENNIFRLFGLWQGIEWDGKVEYPRKFGIRDLLHDIDMAIQASIAVPSKTFAAEAGRRLAARYLKDAEKETLDKIESELTTDVDFDKGAGGGDQD